jgi:hypothetical protein
MLFGRSPGFGGRPGSGGRNVPRGQLSGYTARVPAAANWWQAAKEDAVDSYAALFTGDPLDPDRHAWLCQQVDELVELEGCVVASAAIRP